MSIPEPRPGLVIRYGYLWHSEFLEGREEGAKDRPAAIVAALSTDLDGEPRVLVLPITHAPPADPELAIEIPAAVKHRLGLDADRSWIILSEANEFVWPGPDLRPAPGSSAARFSYGFLPPRLFDRVKAEFVAAVRARRVRRVPRTE